MSAPEPIDTVTVPVIASTDAALARLCAGTELSRTDVINRAVQIYDWIEDQRLAGRVLCLRDGDEIREVRLS